MPLFKIPVPELDRFPIERRKAIVEAFDSSPETAVLRERLGKIPFRLAAVLLIPVIGIMMFVYHMDGNAWPCLLAGFLCFAVGMPLGILIQQIIWRRALREFVRKSSADTASQEHSS